MKTMITLALITFASVSVTAKTGCPEGTFKGLGTCTTAGGEVHTGEVSLEIKGDTLTWIYDPKGHKIKHFMKVKPAKGGYFTFTSEEITGEGYCGERSC